MSRRTLLVCGLILLALTCLIWFLWPKRTFPVVDASSLPKPSSQSTVIKDSNKLPDGRPEPVNPEAAKRGVKEDFGPDPNSIIGFAKALALPFTHYGKVIDENGNPIPDATVTWGANNNPNPHGQGTGGTLTTDADGGFVVKSRGLDVYVEASKSGYASFSGDVRAGIRGSRAGYMHGGKLGNTDLPMGTEQNPGVLVLRKMGEAAALVRAENSANLPKNGSPVTIDLALGKASARGDVKVECWVQDQGVDTSVYNPYDWRCVISVPGGGLVERADSLDFTAPTGDYRPSDEIQMPKTADKWRPQVSKEYFIKRADGTFGRVQIRVVTGANNFVRFESYVNPEKGERNLQYDPAKQLQ